MKNRKRYFIVLTLFTVAVLLGFIGESAILESSESATHEMIAKEMARVIKVLEPVRRHSSLDGRQPFDGVIPEQFRSVVQRGLMKSLPDGTWQWEKGLTRGEGLYYFARLLEKLSQEMILAPVLISIDTDFADIGPSHWLRDSLKLLAGTGALSAFSGEKLLPDKAMKAHEIRLIGSALIEYLGSNCLLIIFDGKSGRMRTKGTLRPIEIAGWRYSFNRTNWFAVDPEGMFFPDFSNGRRQSIYFMNDQYVQTGSFEVIQGVSSAGMIKLQKKYAIKESVRASGVQPVMTFAEGGDNRQRLRNRLLELQNKNKDSQTARKTGANVITIDPNVTFNNASVNRTPVSEAPAASTANVAGSFADETAGSHTADSEVPLHEINEEPAPEVKKPASDGMHEGIVVDAVTGKQVQGASILVGSRQVAADAEGKFRFAANTDDVLEVTVYSEGYEPLSLRHRVGYRNGPLKLSLKPVLTTVSGKMLHSESGRPIGKVLVKIGTRATRTGDDGRFVFKGVKPGYHQLSCFSRGFMEAHEIIHVGNEAVDNLEVKIRPIFEEFTR